MCVCVPMIDCCKFVNHFEYFRYLSGVIILLLWNLMCCWPVVICDFHYVWTLVYFLHLSHSNMSLFLIMYSIIFRSMGWHFDFSHNSLLIHQLIIPISSWNSTVHLIIDIYHLHRLYFIISSRYTFFWMFDLDVIVYQ